MEDLFYVEIKDFIIGNGNTYYNINSKIMMKKREKAYEEKNYVITGVNSDTCIFNKRLGRETYYSYNNVGLNYSKSSGGFYGAGKNGYKWVKVTSVSGNKIKYRYAKFAYDRSTGHNVIKPYGKTYTTTLTGSTRYYKGASWSRLNSLRAYQYGYHSSRFKSLKILQRCSKSSEFGRYYKNGSYYIKIVKGKVKTVVSPVVFAI